MAPIPGLAQRGQSYIYRRRVPTDIADTYPKREEVIALKTRDYNEAVKRARQAAVDVDHLFDAHRQARAAAAVSRSTGPTKEGSTLSAAERQRLCDVYYQQRIEDEPVDRHETLSWARRDPGAFWAGEVVPIPNDRGTFRGEPYSFWHDMLASDGETSLEDALLYAVNFHNHTRLKQLEDAYTIGDCAEFLPLAEMLARPTRLEPKECARLALALMVAEMRALKDIAVKDDTRLREITAIAAHAPSTCRATTPPLSEAVQDWANERAKGSWTPKRKAECVAVLTLLSEVVGDRPIEA
jgi:hypothetical protein